MPEKSFDASRERCISKFHFDDIFASFSSQYLTSSTELSGLPALGVSSSLARIASLLAVPTILDFTSPLKKQTKVGMD
jgi:hypothetical protein